MLVQEIEHRALLRRLRVLSTELTENCDRINYGGCCVMAGIAGEALLALGVQCEVIAPWKADYSNNTPLHKIKELAEECSPEEYDMYGLRRSHLAVRFRSQTPGAKLPHRVYTWDSDGLYLTKKWFADMEYYCGLSFGRGLTVREAQELGKCAGDWNCEFDRDQIPLMQEITDAVLLAPLKPHERMNHVD